MWLWGTLFDLGKTVFRGIGCLWFGAIGIVMLGSLVTAIATSAIRNDPETAAAVAVSAATDVDYRETREWVRDRERYRERRNSVAADWERARREQEVDDAVRSAYDDY